VLLTSEQIARAFELLNDDEDVRDIRFLADDLHLTSPESVLAVVLQFYPAERLPVRTQLLIEEMFG